MTATSPEAPARQKMSYEDFLTDYPGEHAEWVNGEAFEMSTPTTEHQLLSIWLAKLMDEFVTMRQLGVVLPAPYQMKTGRDLPGRQPDILFVAKEHLNRLKVNHLEGPADLVVEITSPESGTRDRGDKFFEYEQGGVPEYWLIDPRRRQAEFYQMDDDGLYQPATTADGVYHSRVLDGLWLRTEWLWAAERPSLVTLLREWGVV